VTVFETDSINVPINV